MELKAFYQSLNPLEKIYWKKFDILFKKVSAQKPEKGIYTLIERARKIAKTEHIPLKLALEKMLEGATERTERRIALLNQCDLKFK